MQHLLSSELYKGQNDILCNDYYSNAKKKKNPKNKDILLFKICIKQDKELRPQIFDLILKSSSDGMKQNTLHTPYT